MSGHAKQYLPEFLNLFEGVVVKKRGAQNARLEWDTEALHQTRRVHMAVANADTTAGHSFCDTRGRNVRQIEAESGHALVQAGAVVNPVDDGARGLEYTKHL